MTDPARELGLLRVMAADLEQYLLSDVVYWPLSGAGSVRDHVPQLSLGSLLLTVAKLKATTSRLSPVDHTEFAQLEQTVDAARNRWRANWLKKAEKEVETRNNAWARAVQERSSADYPPQAQSRLMLELVLQDAGRDATSGIDKQRARLATLDSAARGRFTDGSFGWDKDLELVFDKRGFWFLYGKPVEAE